MLLVLLHMWATPQPADVLLTGSAPQMEAAGAAAPATPTPERERRERERRERWARGEHLKLSVIVLS